MENSVEFYKNQKDMNEGIREIFRELFGYNVLVYQLIPSQNSGNNREIKFKKYLEPVSVCGRLSEDPTKKDRTDMTGIDVNYQYKTYIDIPVQCLKDVNLSTNEDDMVRLKLRINDTDFFPYEAQILSYMFDNVLVYRFVCRAERPVNESVVRP